jgi:glycosyltransferase involved in cell wall biosynthesis
VLIVDTGSDDNTVEVINNWLGENFIQGQVIIEPWKNFAYNRSFALEQLRKIELSGRTGKFASKAHTSFSSGWPVC